MKIFLNKLFDESSKRKALEPINSRIKEVGDRALSQLLLDKEQLCIFLNCSIQKEQIISFFNDVSLWNRPICFLMLCTGVVMKHEYSG